MRKIYIFSLFIFFSAATNCNVIAQKFLPDDPIWNDPDQMSLPLPKAISHSEYYDFYNNTFLSPGKSQKGVAQNVNTLGEVPNSSWYTNRHYWFPMDIESLKQGTNHGSGISLEGTWDIIQGKSQGVTPGFTVRDKTGNIYLIKFDPPDYPELATGAEMICTKFFHALGYNVPENYLIRFKPGKLVLSPTATTRDAIGRKKPLTEQQVEEMLAKAYQDEEGYYRVIASKFLSGQPIGPFLYYGTRPDDPNDINPHETRRELRGLRVFCAWLNHDDSRAINSLDMIVEEAGSKFVRHHLIDFGSTLGSGSVTIQAMRPGNEYLIEPESIVKGIVSFGFWIRPWEKIMYPDFPSIGRIEGDSFDPVKWKPEYPNPAFQNCDAEDAFWAAKQVTNFTDNQIRAIVATAKYSDPEAEEYLIQTLIKRRDKIGRAYLSFSGGLDKFNISQANQLIFEDLLAKYSIDNSHRMRKISWAEFDNSSGKICETLTQLESSNLQLNIPASNAEFLVAIIETHKLGSVEVFIRNTLGELKVVGIKRR